MLPAALLAGCASDLPSALPSNDGSAIDGSQSRTQGAVESPARAAPAEPLRALASSETAGVTMDLLGLWRSGNGVRAVISFHGETPDALIRPHLDFWLDAELARVVLVDPVQRMFHAATTTGGECRCSDVARGETPASPAPDQPSPSWWTTSSRSPRIWFGST